MVDIKPEEIIKKVREEKGYTQQQLADLLDIKIRNYQHIEAGRFPKYKNAVIGKLEKVLGVQVYDKIYGFDDNVLKDAEQHLIPAGITLIDSQSDAKQYIKHRRDLKNGGQSFMVPFVNTKVQAGYIKAMDSIEYSNTLQKYSLPPGVDPLGAEWLYFEVDGIHEPIVSKLEYYKAISRLNKRQAVTQPADEVWLRGILYCKCGRKLTAGNSKSKSGKYYWYYKCNTHKEVNLSANKLHKEFLLLLDTLSFDEKEVEAAQKKLQEKIKQYQNNKGGMIMQLNIEHQKTEKKIKDITQKFLLTEHIDKDIFEHTLNDLKSTLIDLEVKLVKAKTDTDTMHNIMKLLLPKLSKLSAVFKTFPLYRQHQLINTLFPQGIWYDSIYRTPYLFELYTHKALILKEKGLLVIEQPLVDLGEIPLSTLSGNPIELLEIWLKVLVA